MIKHILSDGTELDSIEGLIVPPSGQTEARMQSLSRRQPNQKPLEQ